MIAHTLDHLPVLIAESDDLIGQIDQALMAGFGAGRRHHALAGLHGVFEGQPLAPLLAEALSGLAANQLHERHFAALAAARCAVLGAQYDLLRSQFGGAFGHADCDIPAPSLAVNRTPLHDTTRHWLAELAISGLGRLNAGSITPFLPALDALRHQAASARLAFVLTGFVDEVLGALPLSTAEQAPARRWCDLWSSAMMLSLGEAPMPAPTRVSGQLLPLGIETRRHAKLIGIVVHGLLLRDGAAHTVRIPWSRFKVDALGSPEWWLLVPEIAPLTQALSSGRTLDVSEMECQGNVVRWDAACIKGSVNMRLLDVAAQYLAPGSSSPACVGQAQAHERHPVQLAEPVVLTHFVLDEQSVVCSSGTSTISLPLCPGWEQSAELSADVLGSAEKVFGLIHFEQQRWVLRPLSIAAKNGKLTFAGQSGAKLLAKPPKSSSVAILQERASRLLRA